MEPPRDIFLSIVVPCYNEEKRLPVDAFRTFLKMHPHVQICFVDDGSSDRTIDILDELNESFENVEVVSYTPNKGKAEAVRTGINHCNLMFDHQYIAYLDADLATPLEDCLELTDRFSSQINFVFGSRILKVGSHIERKKYRFLAGRIIATFISNILKLKVYDTQCGCKLFTKNISEVLFRDPFISKWLFDVEIFKRFTIIYGHDLAIKKMIEVPLKRWVDVGESKVSKLYFFKLWGDLLTIHRSYKHFQINTPLNSKTADQNAKI